MLPALDSQRTFTVRNRAGDPTTRRWPFTIAMNFLELDQCSLCAGASIIDADQTRTKP
jgi:hypothetical protein